MAGLTEPKKPQSGYFLWLNTEGREQIMKELGTKDVGAVGKKAGEKWKGMSAAAKDKFEKMAVEAKAQYEKDLAAYIAAGGVKGAARKEKSEKKAAKMAKKKDDDPTKPKRPAGGGYGCFLAANRAEFTKQCAGQPISAVTKLAGEKWGKMSEADKKPFGEEYQKKKAAFEKELEVWKAKKAAECGDDDGDDDEDEEPAEPVAKKAKKASPEKKTKASPEKKPKGRGKGDKKVPDGPVIEADVMAKAEKLNLAGALVNLAGREEMKNIAHSKMVEALQASNGLVNKAKASLLGA